jgi:hypothetical protein
METRPQEVKKWFAGLDAGQRQQAEWLASTVHAADQAVTEAIKWRRLTFTVDDNWHHWLCAVAVTTKSVSLMFHKGSMLADPTGLLEGDHSFEVQATNGFGLVEEPAAGRTWIVDDQTAPETTIDSGPPERTTNSNVTLTFSSNEPDASFRCSLNGEPFAGCDSPYEVANLALGDYTLEVHPYGEHQVAQSSVDRSMLSVSHCGSQSSAT